MIPSMKNRLILTLICIVLVILAICFPGCSTAADDKDIEPGSYQLEKYLKLLEGKHIALVVNHTSVIYNTHLLDTLISRGIVIEKIFSPEHGFWGRDEAGVAVDDEKYSQSLIPVISLYGTEKKPAISDMKKLELVVFDIQDVGARFYTYLSTLHYVMEACAESNIPLLVLDRPNPNGFYVDGPVLKKEFKSFVGLHPVPLVYGMTIGEYANMINGEGWLKNSVKCDLTIIKCENYSHSSYYILPVDPSPNLREMRAIYLYPSLAFFEGTIVSIGRGTDFPFLVAGHPDYPDHKFSFIPLNENSKGLDPKLKDKTCFGIDLRKICLDSLKNKHEIDLSYLIDMYHALNRRNDFFSDYFDLLAGTDKLKKQITEGKSIEQIQESWIAEIEEFKKIRAKYLLYPE